MPDGNDDEVLAPPAEWIPGIDWNRLPMSVRRALRDAFDEMFERADEAEAEILQTLKEIKASIEELKAQNARR